MGAMLKPSQFNLSEVVLGLASTICCTLVLYLLVLPIFTLGGIAWLRTFEHAPPIPGSAMGELSLHMTSSSWYTAQSLPAGESVDGMKMETNYWESNMRPVATSVLCSHFGILERNLVLGSFHEVRGKQSDGTPTCDVTVPFKANLTDFASFESGMGRGLVFQNLFQQESVANIGWMAKLTDFLVVLKATVVSNVNGIEVTKELSTARDAPAAAATPEATPAAATEEPTPAVADPSPAPAPPPAPVAEPPAPAVAPPSAVAPAPAPATEA